MLTFQALHRLHYMRQTLICSRTFYVRSKYSLWYRSSLVSVKGQLVHSGDWRPILGTRRARTDSLDLRWCTCIVICSWTLRTSWGHLPKGIHHRMDFSDILQEKWTLYSWHYDAIELLDRSKVLLMRNVFFSSPGAFNIVCYFLYILIIYCEPHIC